MTTFGWKRKVGQSIAKDVALKFSAESELVESHETSEEKIQKLKRRKESEDANRKLKSDELRRRGEILAQQNKYQEAVSEWDKALNLFPKDEKIFEMKAQALLELNDPYPAVLAAEKAVKLNPQWWVAYQTLGRSQLGMGDILLAKISFSKAIFLNPGDKELWEDDLKWTLNLIKQKEKMEAESQSPESIISPN